MIISTITILVMVFVSPWCIRQGSKWHKLLEHILQQSKLRDLLGASAALLLEVKSDTATWRVSQPHTNLWFTLSHLTMNQWIRDFNFAKVCLFYSTCEPWPPKERTMQKGAPEAYSPIENWDRLSAWIENWSPKALPKIWGWKCKESLELRRSIIRTFLPVRLTRTLWPADVWGKQMRVVLVCANWYQH